METLSLGDDLQNHPFTSCLESGEAILWVGRPDRTVYERRAWGQFRVGITLWCLLMVSSAFGLAYPTGRFSYYACAFLLAVLPVLLWMSVRYFRESYRYASWYALTDRHVFAATPDDSSFIVHKTKLGNVTDVSVPKVQAEVGTVCCRCYYSVHTLLSKNLRLENVSHPELIRDWIQEAKLRASEGPRLPD